MASPGYTDPEPFDPETGEINAAGGPAVPESLGIEHSAEIGKIAEALAGAQKRITRAAKDAENPHYKAAYTTLGAAIDACRVPLADANIAVIQSPYNARGNFGVVTMLIHASGQWLRCRSDVKPVRSDVQGMGSIISYLRRYQLMAMAGVASEDDDGESVKAPPQRAVLARPPAKPKPPEDDDPVRKEFRSIKAAILAAPHTLALDSLKEVCAPGLAMIKERSEEAHGQLVELFDGRRSVLAAATDKR